MTSLRPSTVSSVGISKLWDKPSAQFGTGSADAAQFPRAILVADSEFVTRESLGDAIRRANPSISVVEALDGPGALEAISDPMVGMAFVDRCLPGLNGREFVSRLAARGGSMLMCMLTDRLVPQWAKVARSVGAHDTLMKPVRRERIGSLLKAYGRLCNPSNALVVESSPKLRDIVGSMLATTSFKLNLDLNDSAVEAVRSLPPDFYDVALVNVVLADGDGVETALRIAARSPATRVVTYGTREGYTASLLKQLGVAAHLPAPFKEHELEKALYDAFGLWRPYLLNALGRVEQLDQSSIDYLFR